MILFLAHTPPMQKDVCAVKRSAGKIISVIESIPSKETGNFVMATPSTTHEGIWRRKS
jgi:hypothetical protein